MTTASEILQKLTNNSVTLGWDIVVAYERDKINALLEQQYVDKVQKNQHFTPINDSRRNVYFKNLTLGVPLISFENSSVEDSRATATIDFISGSIIEVDDNGQVSNFQKIEPGHGYSMVLNVDLKAGDGSVGADGEVVVNFREGTLSSLNFINEPHAEVMEFFRSWLGSQNVVYQLGKLDLSSTTGLTPRAFRIRTQPAPGAKTRSAINYGDGAVLLFVATSYNPQGGALPGSSYPWLIPEENSSALIINNKLIISNFIKPPMDKVLNTGSWELATEVGGSTYLVASPDAKFKRDYLRASHQPDGTNGNYTWTGTHRNEKEIHEDFYLPVHNATIKPSGEIVKLHINNEFSTAFGGKMYQCTVSPSGAICANHWNDYNLGMKTVGDADYSLMLDPATEEVRLENKAVNIIATTDTEKVYVTWREYFGPYIGNIIIDDIGRVFVDALSKVSFSTINVFASNHLLFPSNNINTLKSVHMPADMVIFGDISPSLTSFRVTPLKSTVAAGSTLQFTKNTDKPVTWSISPLGLGNIDSNGLYTAPASLLSGSPVCIVTAKDAQGNTASAAVTLVASSVALSPSFLVFKESSAVPVQLKARLLGDNTKVTWSIKSDSEIYGTLTDNGIYTPPDEPFQVGLALVVVTATAPDGGVDMTYICLSSKDVYAEFAVNPAFYVGVKSGEKIMLNAASNLDFSPSVWSHFPSTGALSQPVISGGIYSVEYTAGQTVNRSELVFIRTNETNKPHRVGYSVIEVNP